MKYDVVIIGAGPAGIFTALELVRNGSDKKILMVEKGKTGGQTSLPESRDRKMYELQAELHDHYRIFRSRCIF